MAEVLLGEGTDAGQLDEALKRLKKFVGSEGVLKQVKQRRFEGAMTKAQKRRQKNLASLRRYRRLRNKFRGRPDPHDQNDLLKLSIQDSPLFANDVSWAISETEWKPDLTPKNISSFEKDEPETSRRRSWRKSFESFGQGQPSVFLEDEPAPSSKHVCVIGEVIGDNGATYIPLVRTYNDDGTERDKFQFPGGEVNLEEETTEEAAVREFKEETNLRIKKPTGKDMVFSVRIKNHEFLCYRASVCRRGELKAGDEVIQLEVVKTDWLDNFVRNLYGMCRNHAMSFLAYQKLKEKENV